MPPVNPPETDGADQLYSVLSGTIPFVIFVGLTLNIIPLQIFVAIAVISATGLMVAVTVNVAPIQVPETGVTMYVAVCVAFVGFINVPLIAI